MAEKQEGVGGVQRRERARGGPTSRKENKEEATHPAGPRPKAPRAAEVVLDAPEVSHKDPLMLPTTHALNDTAAMERAAAEDIFTIPYDSYTAADLHALLQRVTRKDVERRMVEREQQRRKENQAPRVERFLDAAVGADRTGSSSANTGASSEMCCGYAYDDMLQRLVIALNRNKESGGMSERNKLPVPMVEKVGKKKVAIINFGKICEAFNRPIEDVKDYIEKELSVGGNLDSSEALILKYEIQKVTAFDKILIKYLDEYVKCNSCHKIDTTLAKEGRRMELRCNWCTATRSVQAVGSATYSAQVGKRSRARRQAMTL
uniref:Uncharacterized protein TCIL3000_5_3490 n=1 Tax=Trypanosoma congolense (strain IL3000) TaxID=1068625 RepID=G0ULV6_TRYCI|nr:unnamed protein product [Trypanosoma congolense IL3000]